MSSKLKSSRSLQAIAQSSSPVSSTAIHYASPSASSSLIKSTAAPKNDFLEQQGPYSNQSRDLALESPHHIDTSPSTVGTTSGPEVSRQDNYFAARPTPASRTTQTQTCPLSDRLPTPTTTGLSPDTSLGLPSCKSWDSGQSRSSGSSGGYLSPPLLVLPTDYESPPYKPQSRGSVSLTMFPEVRLSDTKPLVGLPGHNAKNISRRQGYIVTGRSDFSHRLDSWSDKAQDRQGGILVEENTLSGSNFPSRRWSSSGSASVPRQPPNVVSGALHTKKQSLANTPPEKRFISISHECERKPSLPSADGLVGTIRRMMTFREIEPMKAKVVNPPPISITLRRATRTARSNLEGLPVGNTSAPHVPTAGSETDVDTDYGFRGDLYRGRATGTYLITNEDVEAITRLVDEEIQNRSQVNYIEPHVFSLLTASTPIEMATQAMPDGSSSTGKTFQQPELCSSFTDLNDMQRQKDTEDFIHASDSTDTPYIIPSTFPHYGVFPHDSNRNSYNDAIAQINPSHGGLQCLWQPDDLSRNSLQRRLNEVICKPETLLAASPLRQCELPRNNCFASGPVSRLSSLDVAKEEPDSATLTDTSETLSSFPPSVEVLPQEVAPSEMDSGPPTTSRPASSSSTPRNDLCSHPRESFKTTRQRKQAAIRSRRRPRLTVSESHLGEISNVISFPPLLSRKTTIDWQTPLPSIDTMSEMHNSNLYSLGLDLHCTYSSSSSSTITPYKPLIEQFRSHDNDKAHSALESPNTPNTPPSIEFKAGLQLQPKATPRLSVSSDVCHPVGALSRDRRRSSAIIMRRVTTVDNARKAKQATTWTKARPPSVCPAPQPPTPTETCCELWG